ncbi:hypothetical protein Barb7_00834 [Bacteroidales bacterium Barb7]|nr:hypothetical protein Barb7_00834 [Bacteroidales bacterium Barb7]
MQLQHLFQLYGLQIQLLERRVAGKGGLRRQIVAIQGRFVIRQLPLAFNGQLQVHAQQRLQLPFGKDNGVGGLQHVRLKVFHSNIGAYQVVLGNQAQLKLLLDIRIVGHGIVVAFLKHTVGIVRQQNAVETALYLIGHLNLRRARLLNGKLHIGRRNGQAFPQGSVDQRHTRREADAPVVVAPDGDALLPFRRRNLGIFLVDGISQTALFIVRNVFGKCIVNSVEHRTHHASYVKRTVHIHHLLFQRAGIVRSEVNLREQCRIRTLLCIFLLLNLLSGNFHRWILAQRNLQSLFQVKNQRFLRLQRGKSEGRQQHTHCTNHLFAHF